MTYPYTYPNNRLIVGGVDLTAEFDMILVDGYVLNPPEPKFYTVDVPGGNGVIDLTEVVGGDVSYSNREQEFTFKLIYPSMYEQTKTKLSNFLHGKMFNYKITMDPEYTYKGRFSIVSYTHVGLARGKLGEIVIKVSADPYKYKDEQVFRINGTGGKKYYFSSGRKKVHPTIHTSKGLSLVHKGLVTNVGIGSWRLNDVIFEEGVNELYITTKRILNSRWKDFGINGQNMMTWRKARSYTWDGLSRLSLHIEDQDDNDEALDSDKELGWDESIVDRNTIGRNPSWDNLLTFTWNKIYFDRRTWLSLNYDPDKEEDSSSSSGIGGSSGYTWSSLLKYKWSNLFEEEWTWEFLKPDSGEDKEYDSDIDLGGAVAIIVYEWGDL